jgi:protoporphyrinogen oxidase
MPVRELVTAIPEATSGISPEAREVAANLAYRDFITVGLLAKKLAYPGGLTDTWLYIQDPGVRLGRMQIYNNWSKAMLARPDYIWLGLEYFCAENDELWQMPDDELGRFAATELARLGLLNIEDLLDTHIIRVRKAYPAYTGVWERFQILRDALDAIGNLYLIGRNGMHRYNNQDHSMLTAFAAVETLLAQDGDKSRIWAIEPEKEG